MNYTDTLGQMDALFENGKFSLDRWKEYISGVLPELVDLCLEDAKDYDFEESIVPIVNAAYQNKRDVRAVEDALRSLVDGLQKSVSEIFQRDIDVDIILYLGLCNGAGWVTEINGRTVVLLGIEKIIELNWCDEKHLIGLLYHEVGHVFQKQYGVLDREFESTRDQFMWQLFVEGIAMYFEQVMVGDMDFFHQDSGDWKEYLDGHLPELKRDFERDCAVMNRHNQRYFGDWVYYDGHSDAGYYLGARFIRYICRQKDFMDILSFDIDEVKKYYRMFCDD